MPSKSCFVIAPIGVRDSKTRKRSDKVLRQIIRPAVEECGYEAVRADEIERPGLISRQVVRHIMDDDLVVADLTGHNPNVFYELAVRHAIGKPLVQFIDFRGKIPFDVYDIRTVRIDHRSAGGVAKARQDIVAHIRGLEDGDFTTPVHDAILSRLLGLRRTAKGLAREERSQSGSVEGTRLYRHPGYYPIDVAPGTNLPSLNQRVFVKALRYFLEEKENRLAAMDLVYLCEDNRDEVAVVPDSARQLYERLVEKYDLLEYVKNFKEENERTFRNFKRIVEDVGETLDDVHLEILLHDVRNPLRSIKAERNAARVSGRRLNDPSTRFVVEFVRDQGKRLTEAMEGGSRVSYPKQFGPGKWVKATTTPLFHERYGLVAILCLNIDVNAVKALSDKGRRDFFEKYMRTTGDPPRFETG